MAAKKVLHQFQYDGAQATTKRNQAPQNINPNDYQKQRDRLQLMREAIDLENNFAPAKTLNRKYAMYVTPTSYHAQTTDSGLDKDVEEYLNDNWFKNCDVTRRYDFFAMLGFGVIGMNRGGDYGWAYMRPGMEEGMSEDDIVKLPLQIQAVEPDRIGGIYQNVVSNRYVSGIIIGDYGEIESFRVFRRSLVAAQYDDPIDVPAAQFVHYTDPLQIDMYRGVSKLDAAVADCRDFYEMKDYLKGKQKLESALTVFTNSNGATQGTGAMDAYSSTLFPNNQAALQQDILFGQINHLTAGADIKFPQNTSPSNEAQWFMKLLLKQICMSYNLPYSFGMDATELGGVSSRLESEQAKAEFERGQRCLSPHAHRMKNAGLMDAIAKGIFPVGYADKICKGRFGYRPHPQPDIGKEANADVNYNQNGLLDPLQFWIDKGLDPETAAKSFVRWREIKEKAIEGKPYTIEEVYGNGPSKPTNVTESSTESTTTDTQTESKPKKFASDRQKNIGWLVDILHTTGRQLPIDQAIAAAYKIVDDGKIRNAPFSSKNGTGEKQVWEWMKEINDLQPIPSMPTTKNEPQNFHRMGWEENDHPRDDGGEFSPSGGGSSSNSNSQEVMEHPSITKAKEKLAKMKAKNAELKQSLADVHEKIAGHDAALKEISSRPNPNAELKGKIDSIHKEISKTKAETAAMVKKIKDEET